MKQLLGPALDHGLRLLDEIYSGKETHLRPHPLLPVVADSPQQPPGWVISEHLWDYLATALDDQQRLTVGLHAAGRKDYAHARHLLDSLDIARIPAQIMFEIAVDADTTNQDAAASDWYQKTIARGDPDITPRAMARLGGLDLRQDRIDEARTRLRKAAAAGHQDASAEAMFNLGVLESRQGHLDEARSWYRKAIASRNTNLRLLPRRHRVPAHPHPAARPRPRPRPSRPGRPVRRAHPARRSRIRHYRTELTIMPGITLDPADAAELAETLTFLTQWLSGSQKQALADSFAAFVGHPACNTGTLCTDLRRFVFLLGASDGEELFGEPTS
jgi:tetratricopeptide (TPR) repeat protein